ncbi:MAG: glutaredoxin [Candidatus Nomurabacteria bacterium]|nr:glutaredoxin [Candidatus Nomurabacteria bacterium]
MKNVEIYTTDTCHYCNLAKAYFKEHNVAYTEYNVGHDAAKRQEMIDMTHQFGVPVIVVGDTALVGFQEDKIAELLAA